MIQIKITPHVNINPNLVENLFFENILNYGY